jgi:hypothetical protein
MAQPPASDLRVLFGVRHPVFVGCFMSDREFSLQQRFEELFERAGLFFEQHPRLSLEIVTAKEAYFSATGRIKESDRDFGNRMNAFLLWFLFDWSLTSGGGRPLDHYLAYLEEAQDAAAISLLRQQQSHLHSLFDFVKRKSDICVIKDVLTGRKYKVSESRLWLDHTKGALFETRVFADDGVYFLANYLIHHPLEVRRGILKKVVGIRKANSSIKPFLMQLHASHTKWINYRHIHIKSIYHLDNSRPEAK